MTNPKMYDGHSLGELAAGAVGGGAVFGLAYKLWRLLNSDRKIDGVIQLVEKQNKDFAARIDELTKRTDKFAAERNRALVEAAELKIEVKSLKDALAVCHARTAQLSAKLADIQGERRGV